MRHGHHVLSGVDPWLIGAVVLALVCVAGIIVWFVHRRTAASGGLTPAERKNLPFPQCEVLSMLRQHGGPMMQSEIADAIPVDLDDLAETLKGMEAEGLIQRKWESRTNTYLVSTMAWTVNDDQSSGASTSVGET